MKFKYITYLKGMLHTVSYNCKEKKYSRKQITKLFTKAYKLKLYRPDSLLILHSWALFNNKLNVYKPNYKVDFLGNYYKEA